MAYRDPESDDQTPVDTTPPAAKSSAPLLPDTSGDPAALLGGSTTVDPKLQERLIGLDKSKLDYERSFLGETFKEDRFYKGQADRAYSLEAHDLNDPALKGWNADAEKAKYSTDPIQAFGSFASIAGIIAAAFVHAPIATALDASASAMKAIHDGDDKMYDAAHQAWKDNTELFLKRHEMVHQAYTDALEARKANWTIGNDKFKAAALMFGDQQALALHEAGMFPELEKLIQDREMTKIKIQEAAVKNEKDHADLQVMRDFGFRFPNEPEYNPEKNIKAMQQFSEMKRGARSRTPEEEIAVEQRAKELEAEGQSPGQARMQAESEWSVAKGAGALQRTKLQQEGALERAQLSADTKLEVGKLSAETRKELATYAEAGKDKRQELSEKAKQELAGMNNTARKELQEFLETGRNERSKEAIASRDQHNRATEEIAKAKQEGNDVLLSNDAVDLLADQYMAGDKSVLQNLGRGTQGSKNIVKIREAVMEKAKDQGLKGPELALRMAEFAGLQSGERTLMQRTTNIEMFANETLQMIDVARRASQDVPRSQWVPVNKALQSFESNTGDPKIRAFGASINTLINTYAKAIAGGGQATVSDKDHAREIISTADSQAQFDAVMDIIEKELQSARKAPGMVKQQFRDLSGQGRVDAPLAPEQGVIRYDKDGNRVP